MIRMAQSPTNLQEPSMDELLASIREIIEESSAAAEVAGFSSDDSTHLEPGHTILPDEMRETSHGAVEEDSFANAAVPIHDAMKALAARIGLKKQSEAQANVAKNHSSPLAHFITPTPDAAPITAPIAPPPATAPTQISSTPQPLVQTPQMLPNMSLSASIPATPSQPPSQATKIEKPQVVKISPKPQVGAQSKMPVATGHIPLYPQFRTLPMSQQVQDPSQTMLQVTPQAASDLPPPSSPPQRAESKPSLSDLEKGFLAEFEQAASILLRPYIAGWLEEHFHHLFEKILREEIQRLMQKNLRR